MNLDISVSKIEGNSKYYRNNSNDNHEISDNPTLAYQNKDVCFEEKQNITDLRSRRSNPEGDPVGEDKPKILPKVGSSLEEMQNPNEKDDFECEMQNTKKQLNYPQNLQSSPQNENKNCIKNNNSLFGRKVSHQKIRNVNKQQTGELGKYLLWGSVIGVFALFFQK